MDEFGNQVCVFFNAPPVGKMNANNHPKVWTPSGSHVKTGAAWEFQTAPVSGVPADTARYGADTFRYSYEVVLNVAPWVTPNTSRPVLPRPHPVVQLLERRAAHEPAWDREYCRSPGC